MDVRNIRHVVALDPSDRIFIYTKRSERMKTDNEVMNTGFKSIFSTLGMVDAERFHTTQTRFVDYTEWQKKLWQDETVESLSEKAQKAWEQYPPR